jgi:hypothetical protein
MSLRNSNDLDLFPKNKIKLIEKTFSSDELKDYNLLLAKESTLRLNDIGNKYGYTREYARQSFERIFGFKYTAIKNNRKAIRTEKINELRLRSKNPVNKVEQCENLNSTVGKGILIEKKVLTICEALNYKISPYVENNSIDLVINGFNVDVKSCYKSRLTGAGQHTPTYHFAISESQMNADFVICYAVPMNKFFIIPFNSFPAGGHIYIPEKRVMEWSDNGFNSNAQIRINKYYQYLEAWNLLRPAENEVIFTSSLPEQSVAI